MRLGAHNDTTTTGAITITHARHAINNAGRREIGGRDNIDQLINRQIRVFQQGQTGGNHFRQVVRRNVGGHTHGNTRRTINQQIRDTRGQNQRLLFGTIIVRSEINGFFFDIR